MFHVLIRFEVRHLKNYLRFTSKIANSGAVGAVAVFSSGKNCQESVFAGRLKTLNKL